MAGIHNIPGMNIGLPEKVYERLWDLLIGSLANAADHYNRPQLAEQITKLRISPDLPRLINEIVLAGWHDWLNDSAFAPIKAAVIRAMADHMPTMLRQGLGGGFVKPMSQQDLVREVAIWLHMTARGATYGECVRAARQLMAFVQNAALNKQPLQSVIGLILAWEREHTHTEPRASKRVTTARQEARAVAARLRAPAVTTAHLLYGISHLRPTGKAQRALVTHDALPSVIEIALERLGAGEARRTRTDPLETVGAELALADAETLAWLSGETQFTDAHLFRALLMIAGDRHCLVGVAMRDLLKLLNLNAHTLLHTLDNGVMYSGGAAGWDELHEPDEPGDE